MSSSDSTPAGAPPAGQVAPHMALGAPAAGAAPVLGVAAPPQTRAQPQAQSPAPGATPTPSSNPNALSAAAKVPAPQATVVAAGTPGTQSPGGAHQGQLVAPAASTAVAPPNLTSTGCATAAPAAPLATGDSAPSGAKPKPAPTAVPAVAAAAKSEPLAYVDGQPLAVTLKQTVAKVADQTGHIPVEASLRPPVWVNRASNVRHFFVVNGQAPMFLDVTDAKNTGLWGRVAKYSVRLLARDVPKDEPERLQNGYIVSGHLVLSSNLAVFKINFTKPGRNIGLVKRLFQFEVRVAAVPDADLDDLSHPDIMCVRSHLFKVSTKPTRCMCVSTSGAVWTPRQLVDRWPALGAQPRPAMGKHNVRSRLGDVNEVAVSYSNGAVTPPWGAARSADAPCRPGLAFELRFCSPTRCLNFFSDYRDLMLADGLDLHLLPTRVWKNEFGIPEETVPPKVRRSRGSGSATARGGKRARAADGAGGGNGANSPGGRPRGGRRGAAATAPTPRGAASMVPALRRTVSDVPTHGPPKRRATPAALARSRSSSALPSHTVASHGAAFDAAEPAVPAPPCVSWDIGAVVDMLTAAAEACKTPAKEQPSPAKVSSATALRDLSSPRVRRPLNLSRPPRHAAASVSPALPSPLAHKDVPRKGYLPSRRVKAARAVPLEWQALSSVVPAS